MPIYTLPELKLIFRFISMKNVHFALDGWICFDGSCRFAQSGLVSVEGGNGRGKKKETYTLSDDCISFYCIHYLITIILIGKKYIYTNKLNLITGIFQIVRKQWATYDIVCFECL